MAAIVDHRLKFALTDGAGATPQFTGMPEWDLTDLYSGPAADDVAADIAATKEQVRAFAQTYQGKLIAMADEGRGGAPLSAAVRDFEKIQDMIGRLASYAGLLYAADTADPENAKFYGDMQGTLTEIGSELLFFPLELNRIDDAILEACCADAALGKYKPWLDMVRKDKPYQLEDKLEQLFHEKSVTGRGAFTRLFSETMTALRFDIDGEQLALEPTLNLLLEKDEQKRQNASSALSVIFQDNIRLFTLITNTLAKDKEISDRWRGFKDVADARHLSNDVEREVVEALVQAVRDKYPAISHRYYALKAKWLGKDKLKHWDRNAPLPEGPTRIIDWPDAKQTVLSAYAKFSPEMSGIARSFFDNGWIDAPVREGKSPGAFAHPTVPSAHPYILLNYQGKPRDVMTLAHELGHGVHQVLANTQGALMAPTPLTLAETASVFGEMLTFKALLSECQDPAERKAMLASKVEDMINTVIRQIAFYTFEREIHLARRDGELTSDQISEIWLKIQKESLGDHVELGPGYETFWCYIPHFINSPFYVYAYAFGECLVNSLYSVYEQSEAGFAQKYLDMLRAGGSKHHKELLAPFGLDASDPDFWARGMTVVEALLDELEKMD